jgi:hypothetical protein
VGPEAKAEEKTERQVNTNMAQTAALIIVRLSKHADYQPSSAQTLPFRTVSDMARSGCLTKMDVFGRGQQRGVQVGNTVCQMVQE